LAKLMLFGAVWKEVGGLLVARDGRWAAMSGWPHRYGRVPSVTPEPRSIELVGRLPGGWRAGFNWRKRRSGKAGLIAVLAATQWLNWSSTYYLMTVLARPIAAETGWSLAFVVAGLSLGLVAAGLVSPSVGRAIERHGGRLVLALGSFLLAVGLAGVGLMRGPTGYLAAWVVIGIAMAASLSDAAFATLGRLYGLQAKAMISNLLVIVAFTAAFSWPVTALLTDALGWRGACFCYAALHLAIGLPMHFFLLPNSAVAPVAGSATVSDRSCPASPQSAPRERRALLVWLLGANVTLHIVIGSVIAVHLLSLLQGLGLAYAIAVGFGSLMWFAQAAGRVIDAVAGSRFDPVAEGMAACLLVLLGIALFLVGKPEAIAIGVVVFGAGNGIRVILKGTLPLVLFGAEGYARLIGRLGFPTLVAQAAGPALGAMALARCGAVISLAALAALAALNLGLAYSLRIAARRAPG
jgi:MFS family permease